MIRRLSTVVAATLVAILFAPGAALAHIEILTAQPNGDGTTTLTFAFDHSCPESTTTELTVALPPEATPTTATGPSGWTTAVNGKRIAWTGPGVVKAAGFAVVIRIIARPGQTLVFPTIQRCADGNQYTWIDPRSEDEHPAPRLVATTSILAGQPPAAPHVPPSTPVQGVGAGTVMAILAGFVIAAAITGYRIARHTSVSD